MRLFDRLGKRDEARIRLRRDVGDEEPDLTAQHGRWRLMLGRSPSALAMLPFLPHSSTGQRAGTAMDYACHGRGKGRDDR